MPKEEVAYSIYIRELILEALKEEIDLSRRTLLLETNLSKVAEEIAYLVEKEDRL